MDIKRVNLLIGLFVVLLLILVGAAFTTTTTSAAEKMQLQKIIEAARTEGEVNYFAAAEWEEGPIGRDKRSWPRRFR